MKVSVSKLKAHLTAGLRRVQRGGSLARARAARGGLVADDEARRHAETLLEQVPESQSAEVGERVLERARALGWTHGLRASAALADAARAERLKVGALS